MLCFCLLNVFLLTGRNVAAMGNVAASISSSFTIDGNTNRVNSTMPLTDQKSIESNRAAQSITKTSQIKPSDLSADVRGLTVSATHQMIPSSNLQTYLPSEDNSMPDSIRNIPYNLPTNKNENRRNSQINSSFSSESNINVMKFTGTESNPADTIQSLLNRTISTSSIIYTSSVTSDGRVSGMSSVSLSIADSNTQIGASTKVDTQSNDNTSINNHPDDSTSINNQLDSSRSFTNDTVNILANTNQSNDSKQFTNHPDDNTVLINHTNDSTAFANPLNESTAITNPLNDSTAITNPLNDSTSITNPLNDSTAITNPLNDSTAITNPLNDSTTISNHLNESTTITNHVNDSTTITNHVNDSTTISNHVNDSTDLANQSGDSTTVPTHSLYDHYNLTDGITGDPLVNTTETSTEDNSHTSVLLPSSYLSSIYSGTPSNDSTVYTTLTSTESITILTSKQINTSTASLQLQFVIKYNQVFHPEYLDNTSHSYSNLKGNITNQLTEQYKSVNHFKAIIIHGFSNGSIVVDYDLELYAFNQEGSILNTTQLKEDLTKVKGQLIHLPDIDNTYLDVHYDVYVDKAVQLVELAAQDRCQFQEVCPDPLYACDSQMGVCVLKCRHRDVYQRPISSSNGPYTGVCKCFGQGQSGKLVNNEDECWAVSSLHVDRRLHDTEIIALSVSLSLAVIMVVIIAAVWITVPNKHNKVAPAVDITVETKEESYSLDNITRGEGNPRNSEQSLQLKHTNIESGWDTDDQRSTSELDDTSQVDGSYYNGVDFQPDVIVHQYYNETLDNDSADIDWRDVALRAKHVQLPRLLMSDE